MAVDLPARPHRAPRGRRRETWACTTTATVTIRDLDAINDAFAELEEAAFVGAEAGPEDPEGLVEELSPMGQLAWLVWPTAGMDLALEVDAFRIDSVEVEVLEDGGDRGILRWAVSVKLRDVDALRRLALAACPEDSEPITDDFAVVWRRAIDPFAPIRPIAGIDWRPGAVDVTHFPRRARA